MIRIFPNLDYSEIRKWLAIEKTGLILGFQAGKPILWPGDEIETNNQNLGRDP